MTRVAVSACLIGRNCRWDGGNNACAQVIALSKRPDIEIIEVCPEVSGGLGIPRPPAEIRDGRVINSRGEDVTGSFEKGARACLARVLDTGCACAVLKARSPSCGCSTVYDGTFSHTLVSGDGLFSALLREHKIPVCDEEHIGASGVLR